MQPPRSRRSDVSRHDVSHRPVSDVSQPVSGDEVSPAPKRRKQVAPDVYARVAGIAPPGGDPWDVAVLRYEREEVGAGKRPRTVQLDRENLAVTKKLLLAAGLPADPYQISREHLLALIAHMRASGRSPRTINIRRQVWRKFFGFLHGSGALRADPSAGLKKQPEGRRLPKALDDEEVRRLLAEPDRTRFSGLRNFTMILLVLDTGLRLGEVLRLERRDLDLRQRTVHVRGETKNRRERQVYLSQRTVAALAAYLAERGDLATERVFVSRDDEPLNASSFQGALAEYGKRSGVRVSPHRLRHTFARCYVMNGGDPFSLVQIMGHRDMDMARQYLELWGTDVQAQHERFSPLRRFEGGERGGGRRLPRR